MNYSAAIRYLYDLQLFGMKLGLENTLKLGASVGNPQNKLRFIHVAGTNGKGSTCAMLESIYRHAGVKVGLFTSPHLVSFTERIQINRQPISEENVARLVSELSTLNGQPSTFFEFITVMALKYFAEQQCDLVIWETGMGGRLDATNIVTPLASVITNIQLDHQKYLGDTLEKIAEEKAGIIKPGVPVLTAAVEPALSVIVEKARELSAPLTVVTKPETSFEIGLGGEHQKFNATLALVTVRALVEKIPVSEPALVTGLKTVQWSGRFQIIQRGAQTIILDGAHNPDGARTLVAALNSFNRSSRCESALTSPSDGKGIRADSHRLLPEKKEKLSLILGLLRDKDYHEMCHLLAPMADKIFLVPVSSERTAQPAELVESCRKANPQAEIIACQNLNEAFARVWGEPLVIVAGSLYFVGEALETLGLSAAPNERSLNEYTGKPAN